MTTQCVSFIASTLKESLLRREPVTSQTYRNNCRVRGHDQRDVLYNRTVMWLCSFPLQRSLGVELCNWMSFSAEKSTFNTAVLFLWHFSGFEHEYEISFYLWNERLVEFIIFQGQFLIEALAANIRNVQACYECRALFSKVIGKVRRLEAQLPGSCITACKPNSIGASKPSA